MAGRHLEPADFEGAQLEQMRSWVNGGSGSEALYEQSGYWNAEDQYMRDLKTRLDEKLKQVGAFMQAKSGEAMKDQAMPVVLWTEITADSAKLQSEQMTAQGEAFKKVQTSIPAKSEEQSVPDDGWLEEGWDTMWTGSTDAEDAKAHNEKLRQEAVRAFSTYQDTTQGNVSGSAEFQKPPPVAVGSGGVHNSSVPSSGGVDQPASTSSSSAGSSGSGSAGGPIGGGTSGSSGYSAVGTGPASSGSAWADAPANGGNTGNNPGGGRTGAPGTAGYGGIAGPGGAGAGRPGAGRVGSGSGSGARGGSGAGRGVGSGGGAGRAGGPGTGAGGRAGAGGLGGASGTAAGGTGAAGGRGGSGMAGAGARGRGQEGEDDLEHETPDYLVGDQGVFDEDLPRVAPPVFGE